MRPALSWALVATALLTAFAALRGSIRPSVREVSARAPASGVLPAVCPPGSLPDEAVCIPVPAPGGSASGSTHGAATMPRRDDRPASYLRYRLPVVPAGDGAVTAARPGSDAKGPPLPGIELRAPAGTPVVVRSLEGQQGAATVVVAGDLVGPSLATYHVVRTNDVRQEYVVILGNLASHDLPAPRQPLEGGTAIGKTESAPLYLDVRLLRPGVDVWSLSLAALASDANGVSVDARNVFPLE